MSGYGFSLFGKKPKTSSMDDIDRVLSRMDKIQKEIEEKKAREEPVRRAESARAEEARDNEAIRILEARAEEARREREEMAVKGNSIELRTKNPETGKYDMGGRRRTHRRTSRKLRTKKSKKSRKSRRNRK